MELPLDLPEVRNPVHRIPHPRQQGEARSALRGIAVVDHHAALLVEERINRPAQRCERGHGPFKVLRLDRRSRLRLGSIERGARTAFDVKPVHRALDGLNDEELKQIPVLEAGTRLQQGATYLDLARGEFTATGEMAVGSGQKVVPKDGVHYDTWNKLVGRERP